MHSLDNFIGLIDMTFPVDVHFLSDEIQYNQLIHQCRRYKSNLVDGQMIIYVYYHFYYSYCHLAIIIVDKYFLVFVFIYYKYISPSYKSLLSLLSNY